MRRWLKAVRHCFIAPYPSMLIEGSEQRGLLPSSSASRDELLERIRANMKTTRESQ